MANKGESNDTSPPFEEQRHTNTVISMPRHPMYQTFRYRWIVLVSYFLIKLSSGAIYAVFIPFSAFLSRVYGISHVFVVLTAFTFNGMYPIANFLIANRFIKRFHTKISLIVGVSGIVVCLWMRTLINVWVYFINIASLVGSITNPLIGNIITKLSVNWFPPTQHVGSTVASSLAGVLGSAVGPFYALFFIETQEKDLSEARRSVFYALLYLAITYTSVYIVCLFLYKDKPRQPPGPESVESTQTEEIPNKNQLRVLVTNKDFWIFLVEYNLVLYIVVCLGSNISPFLATYGITQTIIMVSAAAGFLLSGVLGAFVVSLIMAKFPYARITLFTCILTGAVFYIAAFIALSKQHVALLITFTALMGFFLIPTKGILIGCCCGVTDQATEHVINGFVISVYSGGSIIVVIFRSIKKIGRRNSLIGGPKR